MPPAAAPTPRTQQLALWALEAWGRVLPVMLPHAPAGVRDAARAVLGSREMLAHLDDELTPSPPSPTSPPPFLGGTRDAMVALHELDHRRAPPDAYAAILVFLGNLVCAGGGAACELGSSPSPNAALPFPLTLPLMQPDMLLGLNPLEIPVSVGVDAHPLVPAGVKVGLYADSIPDLQPSLCDSLSAPWFPWMFACIAPLDGGLGAAHINVLTAMRTALGLVLKVNTAALERDPANSLPLPPLWRRAYGVYGAGSMWRLVVMVADEKGDFATSEVWCGSATCSSQLLQFIALFSHIAGEAESRRLYVSNWLYSLRSSSVHRHMFQPQGSSAHTTPRTIPAPELLQTPVQQTIQPYSGSVAAVSRILQPLPIPMAPGIPVVQRRERRSISEVSGSLPPLSSPTNACTSSSSYGPVLEPPSPAVWMSPTRHSRRASTTLLGSGTSRHTYAGVLSPFPNRNANGSQSVASYLAATAERSWSAIRRNSYPHSHSTSTTTNSESPTLSDPGFGDENSGLALRRFS